ncbi:hypothetical protein BRADI_2g33277v3 [Brachypodium distachyon]|uniref:Uncharacterized protein n=1 Tax=Brachypodium distachyon TaxID=15368 RepID=A0A2K2DBK0_BRADI|nr:hypothetical protein BRADI_2g33277v3 [Brachypodium distachyon]PNT71655.1 hypothetical protein BRADI_2g33277v3 [Brachypodium distachyon]
METWTRASLSLSSPSPRHAQFGLKDVTTDEPMMPGGGGGAD